MYSKLAVLGTFIAAASALNAKPSEVAAVCAQAELNDNHGCSEQCGYKAVLAGDDYICLPEADRVAFPFTITEEDTEEFCEMVAANSGCSMICGFKFDSVQGECSKIVSPQPASDGRLGYDAPIIGGTGKFRYQYMPQLLQPPPASAGVPTASLVNCHGLVTDKDKNIYLTYQNDGKDKNCLIKWAPDGTNPTFPAGQTDALCSGTPHGLKIQTEGGVEYLYHANNNQKLTKTTMDGKIVWQVNGQFGQNAAGQKAYRPTWFAVPPNSDYMYLCDGYGSNQVYAFSQEGKFQNFTWGGHSPTKGPDAPHGTFSTNHGCTYDPRLNDTIVVSDRANSRFEFFNYDPKSASKFEWYKTKSMVPFLGAGTLPCNLRMYPDQEGRAITADLAGPVGVLDNNNDVVSVVNVSVLLAAEQHKHPHDAMFLPNGDMVVATWAPGRISYWKLLPVEEEL